MALAYVLDPNVQISNRAGVNNVDGWVEVFLSDTDDHAVTYRNFSGTLNPERIVLDNDGRCVIIADNSVAYRVEMYDRTGNLLWTQYPVWCGMSGGGAVATTIESTDGSINVERTQVGSTTRYDLSVNDGDDPEFVEWIRCEGAVSPSANVFYPVKQAGTMDAESTGVLLRKDNLYHVSYVMRATKSTALPFYDRVSAVLKMSDGTNVTTVSTFHGIVDFSLGLSQEFGISADVKVGGTDSHLYVELGDATVSGATYELVSMDAHRVYSGVPVLPDGVARRDWVEENFQRTLTAGENVQISAQNVISATDTKYTAGNGLSLSGTEFSADMTVVQHKLTAGDNIVIEGNTISSLGTSYTAGEGIDISSDDTISVDTSVVQTKLTEGTGIDISGSQIGVDTSVIQEKLTPGVGVTIENNVISATAAQQVNSDWNSTSGVSEILNKPDLSVYATKQEVTEGLADKQDTLTAGSNITITNNVISATAEPQVQSDWAESDSSAVDYIKNKPAQKGLAAGNNITFSTRGSVLTISATAEPQVQADWDQSDSTAVDYIKNKPTLAAVATSGSYNDLTDKPQNLVQDASYVHTDNNFTTALKDKLDGIASGAEVNVQSNWNETNTSSDAYIQNKPTLATVATSGSYNDLTDKPSIPAVPVQDVTVDGSSVVNASGVAEITMPTQVNADWNSTSGVSEILNKPTLATVATSGSYTDLSNTPTIPAAQVNADWDASSGVAQILNKPTIPSALTAGDGVDITSDVVSAKVDGSSITFNASGEMQASGLFEAEYGTSTYSDIVAAIAANKIVYCRANGRRMAFLAYQGIDRVEFQYYRSNANGTGDSVFVYDVDSNNTWSTTERPAYVNADWNAASGSASYIRNKPVIPAAQVNSDWDATSGISEILHKPDLSIYAQSSDLATVATTGAYSDLTGTPTIPTATSDLTNDSGYITLADVPAQVQTDWDATSGLGEILHKPDLSIYAESADLATVATTGSYDDLLDKPVLATVATTGDYTDLSNKPSIPTATSDLTNDSGYITINDVPAQQNADWDATSGVSEILHKPDLSIYAQSADLATVATTGAYSDLTGTPSIPTATSDLTNDSGFITLSDVPVQVQPDWDATSGLGEILHKPDLSVYAETADLATVATTGSYTDLSNKPSIPTATSDLTNDSGFITLSDVPAQVQTDWDATSGLGQILNKPTLATVATSGSYADLSNKPSIPTATSDLTNDSGYITLADVPSQANADWDATSGVSEILHKPDLSIYAQTSSLATVATTGSYTDLSNKPSIPAAQVQSDWDQSDNQAVDFIKNKPTLASVATSGDYDDLSNKPTIPAAQVQSDWSQSDNTQVDYIKNKPSLAAVATSGDYADLSNKPTIPAAQVQADWSQSDSAAVDYIKNKPSLATVATSGSYTDLSNTPTIPAAPVQSNWNESDSGSLAYIQNKPSLATVATSGSYSDLSNKPAIPTVDQTYDGTSTNAQSGVAVASGISSALSGKQNTLTAGDGIDITNDVISWLNTAGITDIEEVNALPASPDAHTLYLTPDSSAQETVLYSGMKTTSSDGAATYTLSESPLHFEYIKVYYCANTNISDSGSWTTTSNKGIGSVEWDTTLYLSASTFISCLMNGANGGTSFTQHWVSANISGIRTTSWGVQASLNSSTSNAAWFHIYKIVGRNRIANN